MALADTAVTVPVHATWTRQRVEQLHIGVIVAAATIVFAWKLSINGWANEYYAATVRSMTLSWHNFFFASFDPTGLVSVDKPPLAFWVEAASVKLFGLSSWSLLLPEVVAGAATVVVLYRTVRRIWGHTAGCVAAIACASTPMFVAVSRDNGPDALLVLCMVAAAAAGLRACESGRLRWVIASAALVGLGFNVKMFAAWLVVPGLAVAYAWCAPRSRRIRLGHLAAAGAVLVAVSGWWIAVVDLWPAADRPYVGSSTDNTAWDLVFGHNGISRIENQGRGGPPGAPGGVGPTAVPGAPARPGSPTARPGTPPSGPGGASEVGEPGWTRLVNDQLGDQASWLLPFALVGGVAALAGSRPRRPSPRRPSPGTASVVVFGGWLLVHAALFSTTTGIFHRYYVAALAPAIGALVGAGAVAMVELVAARRAAVVLPVAALVSTAGLGWVLHDRVDGYHDYLAAVTASVTVVAVIGLLLVTRRSRSGRTQRGVGTALGIGLAACLLGPVAWTAWVVQHPSQQLLAIEPASTGPEAGSPPPVRSVTALGRYLDGHDSGEAYLVAGSSARDVADLIIAGRDDAVSLGGFGGGDRVFTIGEVADLVAQGELRFVLTGNVGPGTGGADGRSRGSAATSFAASACEPVESFPGLYDCAGRAGEIRSSLTSGPAPRAPVPRAPGS